MGEYRDLVCEDFALSIEALKAALEEVNLPVIKQDVEGVIVLLEGTYRPLLDGYYACEYSKEVYCHVRDFRDTALTELDCTIKTLYQSVECLPSKDVCDAKDYIRNAICWIEKAQVLLCDDCSHSNDKKHKKKCCSSESDCYDCSSSSSSSDSCDSDSSCGSSSSCDSCDSDSCDSDSCDSSSSCSSSSSSSDEWVTGLPTTTGGLGVTTNVAGPTGAFDF